MATATMGLRRRVQVGNSSSVAQTSNNKRSRSENNNSPSQGNLNSVSSEPAAKKSRTCTTRSATKAKEMEKKIPHGPPHWSDPRPYASIAGLSLNAQQALCQAEASLPSPMAYLASTTMATFVGNATNLGKNPNTASYLDLSKIIARTPDSSTDPETKNTLGQLFSAATSAFSSTSQSQGSSNNSTSTNNNTTSSSSNGNATQTSSEIQQQIAPITLPKNFPNDSMFNTYQPWVIKTYGDLAKTKTITIKKYARILRTLRGEEANSAENSKFRFWVKSKGFHIGQPEGYDPKPADRIVGRHAVTNLGLDPPLYVPTQPPHNKALNGAEGTVPPGRIYKKVAIVENFFDIIHAVHVDLEGRPGKHAGQKRTYRTITETYAFLPREAVTRFLLGCTECQRRPRTPSPTSAVATPAVATTPTPKVSTPLPSPTERPESPKAATTLSDAAEEMQDSAKKAKETNHSLDCKDVAVDYVKDIKEESNIITPEITTLTTTLTTTTTTTTETSNISGANTSTETDNTNNINKPKMLTRDEKYNPLSITNLLRKDPPTTRRTPIALAAVQHIPEIHMPETPIIKSELSTTSTTEIATTNGSFSTTDYNVNHNRSNSIMTTAVPKKLRMLPENRINRSTPSPKAWSPNVDLKYAPIDYSLPLTVSYLKHQRHLAATMENSEINVQKNKKEMKEKTLTKDIEATVKSEKNSNSCSESESEEEPDYSPATGLIDTNLNLLATIQQLHCQVMLALTERLRPPLCSSPSMTSTSSTTATAAAVTFTSGHNKANNDS